MTAPAKERTPRNLDRLAGPERLYAEIVRAAIRDLSETAAVIRACRAGRKSHLAVELNATAKETATAAAFLEGDGPIAERCREDLDAWRWWMDGGAMERGA